MTAVKACAASIAILLCAYTAVGVITDRSRLQQQLTEQAAALEAAQSAIHELQAAKSNMLEDRQMPSQPVARADVRTGIGRCNGRHLVELPHQLVHCSGVLAGASHELLDVDVSSMALQHL